MTIKVGNVIKFTNAFFDVEANLIRVYPELAANERFEIMATNTAEGIEMATILKCVTTGAILNINEAQRLPESPENNSVRSYTCFVNSFLDSEWELVDGDSN